jgi:hypothetical protein
MAARVGDALAGLDGAALAAGQLRQAEGPAGRRAVGRAGVDEAGAVVVDHEGRLARSRVGQAQEGHVGGVQQARALGRVLALVGIDLQHLDVAAGREVFVNAQARRAFLAVNKHSVSHRVILAATGPPPGKPEA